MTASTEKKYFDLITHGVCYLNRARVVKPQGANNYVCVSLSFVEGDSDNVNYIKMDATVRTDAVNALIQHYKELINSDDNKVIAVVQVGGLRLGTFVVKKGDRAGETFACLKTNLLKIDSLRIDGEIVYSQPSKEEGGIDDEDTDNVDVSRVSMEPQAETEAQVENTDWDADGSSLPAVVKLDCKDDDFKAKKSMLKAQGYHWDGERAVWILAA